MAEVKSCGRATPGPGHAAGSRHQRVVQFDAKGLAEYGVVR